MLPGGVPLRRGYTDQLRPTAGAPEAPLPWQEERLRSRWEDLGEDIVHRERGGGLREASEQVENRRFTLSLYPQGWSEGSRAKER